MFPASLLFVHQAWLLMGRRHCTPSRTKKAIARPDGRTIRFDDNACVLLNQKGEMLGSRISGAVSAELRKSGRWGKVISMAPKVRPLAYQLFSF